MKTRVRVLEDRKVNDEFRIVTKRVTRSETDYIYRGVILPYDIFEALDDLKRTDGFGSYMLLDDKFGELLEAEGCARKTARGSWYGGEDEVIDAFYDKIMKLMKS